MRCNEFVCSRLYVQLPTAAAHEYHLDSVVDISTQPDIASSSRLHPSVAQRIRDIVSGGELRQYYIRQQLRLLLFTHFCLYLSEESWCMHVYVVISSGHWKASVKI